MDAFPTAQQPDEGYSEDPLNPSVPISISPGIGLAGPRTAADMPAWLSRNLPGLPVSIKTREYSDDNIKRVVRPPLAKATPG